MRRYPQTCLERYYLPTWPRELSRKQLEELIELAESEDVLVEGSMTEVMELEDEYREEEIEVRADERELEKEYERAERRWAEEEERYKEEEEARCKGWQSDSDQSDSDPGTTDEDESS